MTQTSTFVCQQSDISLFVVDHMIHYTEISERYHGMYSTPSSVQARIPDLSYLEGLMRFVNKRVQELPTFTERCTLTSVAD